MIYNVQDGVTNETVTLTGNPQAQVVVPEGTNAADVDRLGSRHQKLPLVRKLPFQREPKLCAGGDQQVGRAHNKFSAGNHHEP